jgi:hypothetical protein
LRRCIALVSLASGPEGWVYYDTQTHILTLEYEVRKRIVEVITPDDPKRLLPLADDLHRQVEALVGAAAQPPEGVGVASSDTP